MKRILVLIVKFLRSQLESGSLTPDAAEGVEVASQCIENAYNITQEDIQQETADLQDIILGTYRDNIPAITDEQREEAENLKLLGNALMAEGRFDEAINHYTRAIEVDNRNAVFFCNRAAAQLKLNNHAAAVSDCNEAIRIDPTYSKAFSRLGYTHLAMGNQELAREAYRRALEIEPENENYRSSYQNLVEQMAGPSTAPAYSDLMGIIPGLDISALLRNQSFMQMAGQMLADPGMQTAVSRLLTGQSFPLANVEDLIAAGQQLADRLQQEDSGPSNDNAQNSNGESNAPVVQPDQDNRGPCVAEEVQADVVVVNEAPELNDPVPIDVINVPAQALDIVPEGDVAEENEPNILPPQPFPNPFQGEGHPGSGDHEGIVPAELPPPHLDDQLDIGQGDARMD